jgi:dolichol kinase
LIFKFLTSKATYLKGFNHLYGDFFYLLFIGVPLLPSVFISLAGGVAGGGAEMLPLEIDDNFSIPVVSGTSASSS